MLKRVKYQLAPKYQSLDSWIKELPGYFPDYGETIFKSRNEVKIFEYGDLLLNVKAFKVPNWVNRVVYVYFRASKAQRSFEYAQKFLSLGVSTPEGIGFVECQANGLLGKSFYVSQHCKYDFTLREVLNYQVKDRDEILRQWVRFTHEKLHLNGIFHLDYSPGNTLINKKGSAYEFNIIDLNRMKFGKISFRQGLKNFRQLDTDLPTIEFIAKEYAKLNGKDSKIAVELLTKFHLENVHSRHRHTKMKQSIGKLFKSGRGDE